jgi:hypothetical protein
MPSAERLTVMHAVSFARPVLKNDRAWMARVDAVLAQLKPTAREHEDIVIEATKLSVQLKLDLWGGGRAEAMTTAGTPRCDICRAEAVATECARARQPRSARSPGAERPRGGRRLR